MPFSNSEQISPIFSEIKRKPVRSVLDVGCGLGVYGMLCRVQLDLYNDEQFYEKLEAPNRDRWEIRIDGIEGTPEYVPLIPDWAYDDLEVGEALQALEHRSDGQYDLVLALAIIEHFSKQDGERFLDELIRIGGFNRFLPHPGVWIAVYDPDDQPIEPPSVNSKANPSTATLSPGEEQIVALLQQLDGHVQQMLEQQRITNERLSLSIRIRSLLERLRRPFRSKPTS
ncbi:MAG: hypothetical protein N838_24815 [Thiohalocapsa sp. PB-PSB1]|nr:MAG: hypothetical protein N838_24815 [Thiohalocapsa sp. PB-PSB1]